MVALMGSTAPRVDCRITVLFGIGVLESLRTNTVTVTGSLRLAITFSGQATIIEREALGATEEARVNWVIGRRNTTTDTKTKKERKKSTKRPESFLSICDI